MPLPDNHHYKFVDIEMDHSGFCKNKDCLYVRSLFQGSTYHSTTTVMYIHLSQNGPCKVLSVPFNAPINAMLT